MGIDILHGFHTQSIASHFKHCNYFKYCLPVWTKVLPTVKLWPSWCVTLYGWHCLIRSPQWLILYNFNQFITPPWLWHTWQKFLFITLPGSLWHGQNFVRCCPLSGHLGSVGCWIWGGGTQWKPKLVFCDWKPQILARITLSRSLWQTTLSSSGLVNCDKDQISFHQVALWYVTDKLIEIVQYDWSVLAKYLMAYLVTYALIG